MNYNKFTFLIEVQCKKMSLENTLIHFFMLTEPRVLQVERKSVLKPDQAEFVLSEGMYIFT